MMSKWILRGVLVAGLFAAYDCRRRHDEDNGSASSTTGTGTTGTGTGTTTAPAQGMTPVPTVQPGLQPGLQPGMPSGMMPVPPPVVPTLQPSGDYIVSQMTMRQSQFAQGMSPVMPLTRASLTTGGTQNYAVQMQPGHCYKIIGVGSPTVTDLDLKLYDPAGTKIDEDVATDNFPVVGLQHPLCPTTAGAYRLEVVMFAGSGEFGVQVFGN